MGSFAQTQELKRKMEDKDIDTKSGPSLHVDIDHGAAQEAWRRGKIKHGECHYSYVNTKRVKEWLKTSNQLNAKDSAFKKAKALSKAAQKTPEAIAQRKQQQLNDAREDALYAAWRESRKPKRSHKDVQETRKRKRIWPKKGERLHVKWLLKDETTAWFPVTVKHIGKKHKGSRALTVEGLRGVEKPYKIYPRESYEHQPTWSFLTVNVGVHGT